ncbi:hypothetical protein PAUR_b0694 [Pseudoalteromonas aurantia 208]|uniref:Orphan protein n=1 Tax=Pseudoalteromonas aurantia 208 TaxID=1314867 RepID=A0ABR9EI38_9GAMM|nr:hypothetical protein [Pseudoalteromonas aurantia 208]
MLAISTRNDVCLSIVFWLFAVKSLFGVESYNFLQFYA